MGAKDNLTDEKFFVVSAPSGAGKSTLTKGVVKRRDDIRLSISCTTRPIRGDERDGREYFFITASDFFKRIEEGEFLEWAQVHGHYYGTSRKHVDQYLKEGKLVVFDIDVQGAETVKKAYPEATFVFILPPSRRELERRLKERRTDDSAEMAKRLKNALGELWAARSYNYVIVNDDIERAMSELESIILGEPPPQKERNAFLEKLLSEFQKEDEDG